MEGPETDSNFKRQWPTASANDPLRDKQQNG